MTDDWKDGWCCLCGNKREEETRGIVFEIGFGCLKCLRLANLVFAQDIFDEHAVVYPHIVNSLAQPAIISILQADKIAAENNQYELSDLDGKRFSSILDLAEFLLKHVSSLIDSTYEQSEETNRGVNHIYYNRLPLCGFSRMLTGKRNISVQTKNALETICPQCLMVEMFTSPINLARTC